MMYQLIAEALSSGADPRRIVFLTLDGQGVAHNSESLLRMLELYANGVIREPLSALTKKSLSKVKCTPPGGHPRPGHGQLKSTRRRNNIDRHTKGLPRGRPLRV